MEKCNQKTIAAVNDLSGYGRCALTVSLPVLSSMGIQCCPVPTSILSNHTGFPTWFFDDYTEKMEPYLGKWKELNLAFDGILTGFFGSVRQIRIAADMIRDFKGQDTKVIVDPIMGDHGKTYATCTPQLCQEMEKRVRLAQAVPPNVTEGCILTGREYKAEGWEEEELEKMAIELQKMGPSHVVITGVEKGDRLINVVAEPDGRVSLQQNKKAGQGRPGTGDIFSSIVAGSLILGREFSWGVGLAADFVSRCIQKSEELDIPVRNGVCFELLLGDLSGRQEIRRCLQGIGK